MNIHGYLHGLLFGVWILGGSFGVTFIIIRNGHGDSIGNCTTTTRKSDKHLHTTYGNTGQLFWPY